ncbi:hypothetical protein Lser_V15G23626 [Lactuca serriola]
MTATSKEDDGSSKIASLTPETKEILHQSILHYLHRSGFNKTLKRFQSEAQIQNDMWKSSSANLEEIYCKFVNGCNQAKDDIEFTKKDEKDEKTTISKKKKKKSNADEEQSKSTMSNDEIPQDKVVHEESELKPKKKKKSKHDLASDGETKEEKLDDTVNELEVNEPKKKTKDKKSKSNQEDKPATNDTENGDVVKEDKKSSKKRKRLLSDENENTTEAPKEEEIVENEKPEKNEGEKSQKSVKKQRIDSTEPKTINAFQRVKIDQVEFAHEKLQDNSYWAKDGADIGYGAKAQEVLGLVRGKGFRHEKTKKKRGSYRGGQIDLQSHSIKFNYSDQE